MVDVFWGFCAKGVGKILKSSTILQGLSISNVGLSSDVEAHSGSPGTHGVSLVLLH